MSKEVEGKYTGSEVAETMETPEDIRKGFTDIFYPIFGENAKDIADCFEKALTNLIIEAAEEYIQKNGLK